MTPPTAPASRQARTGFRYVALAALLVPVLGHRALAAVVDWEPYAHFDWQTDSNLFLAPDHVPAGNLVAVRPVVSGQTEAAVAGSSFKHTAGDTKTYFSAEGRKVKYAQQGNLDHTEYTAFLGHARGADGENQAGFEIGASRLFAPFAGLAADQPIAYQRQKYGQVTALVRVLQSNALDFSFLRRDLRAPLAGAPNFNATDNIYHAGAAHFFGRRLTLGGRLEFNDGAYDGLQGFGRFRQLTPELYGRYQIPDLIEVNGAIGVSRRNQVGAATLKATTGMGDFRYQLGPKTLLRLGVVRAVSAYYAVAGSQVNTNATASIAWNATTQLTFELAGGRTHATFEYPGTGFARTDDFNTATAGVTWRPRPWISINGFGRLQNRHSTDPIYQFDANTVGLSVRLQKPARALP